MGDAFAWSDLRDILDNLTPASAYARARWPEEAPLASPEMQMLTEVATILSATRWLVAMSRLEEVPSEWAPVKYGLPDQDDVAGKDDEDGIDRVERARSVAAGMLA